VDAARVNALAIRFEKDLYNAAPNKKHYLAALKGKLQDVHRKMKQRAAERNNSVDRFQDLDNLIGRELEENNNHKPPPISSWNVTLPSVKPPAPEPRHSSTSSYDHEDLDEMFDFPDPDGKYRQVKKYVDSSDEDELGFGAKKKAAKKEESSSEEESEETQRKEDPFGEGDGYIESDMVCAKCKKEILYNVQYMFDEHDNKFHPDCYDYPKCTLCGEGCRKEDSFEALDKMWHQACFLCTDCKTPLEEDLYIVNMGVPYCDACGTRAAKRETFSTFGRRSVTKGFKI